jgi:hypothetical protein
VVALEHRPKILAWETAAQVEALLSQVAELPQWWGMEAVRVPALPAVEVKTLAL